MMDLEFSFEAAPWEGYLDSLKTGEAADAIQLLALTEGESESVLEDVFQALEERGIGLNIASLPAGVATGEAGLRLRQEQQLVEKGLPYETLDEADPLRVYLQEVAQTPAAGDMELLAQEARRGKESAQVALTNLCLSRVIEEAKALVGKGVLLLDLIQEGSLGLWQAVCTWQEGNFEDYSTGLIRLYMAKEVMLQARANGVGQKMRTALEDYRSVDERLLCDLGRNPTVEELAEALHITAEAAASIGDMLETARMMAQIKKEPEPEEEAAEENQAVEDTAYFQMRQRIADLLSELSEEDAKLITLRYGLEGGLPLNPQETGKRLGLTPDEVVAREAAALAKLRKQ